jgi:hypothetical protein
VQEKVESLFHHVLIPKGNIYQIPKNRYFVTAALYQWEDELSVIALISEFYNPPHNIDWFTFKLSDGELEKFFEDFEIHED